MCYQWRLQKPLGQGFFSFNFNREVGEFLSQSDNEDIIFI